MPLNNANCLCAGILPLIIIAMACAGCAYQVNAQRSSDDPQKRSCHPLTVVLVPLTLPLLAVFYILRFLFKVLLFGAVLIVFPFALLAVRETFLLRWLKKIATYIGNKLLDANTALTTPFLKPEAEQPEIKRSAYRADPLFRRFIQM
jgi:hypothetical protein